tara:strand:+ start:1053 stop:1757 length:705 start_codon:yes stop_codon:yes gene_type:complete
MSNNWGKAINVQRPSNNDFNSQSKSAKTIITTSDDLRATEDYKRVKEVIERLIVSGITRMGEGYCISVSDITFNMLSQAGIKSHLMEVQLSAFDQNNDQKYMVGFTTPYQENNYRNVQTHVVVVTATEIPMIIDLSIAHRLPEGYQCIVDKSTNEGDRVACRLDILGWSYIYQEKKTALGLPMLHQVSILERITTDNKIFKDIKSLKTLNYIGIVLSVFAAINVIAKLLFDWYT